MLRSLCVLFAISCTLTHSTADSLNIYKKSSGKESVPALDDSDISANDELHLTPNDVNVEIYYKVFGDEPSMTNSYEDDLEKRGGYRLRFNKRRLRFNKRKLRFNKRRLRFVKKNTPRVAMVTPRVAMVPVDAQYDIADTYSRNQLSPKLRLYLEAIAGHTIVKRSAVKAPSRLLSESLTEHRISKKSNINDGLVVLTEMVLLEKQRQRQRELNKLRALFKKKGKRSMSVISDIDGISTDGTLNLRRQLDFQLKQKLGELLIKKGKRSLICDDNDCHYSQQKLDPKKLQKLKELFLRNGKRNSPSSIDEPHTPTHDSEIIQRFKDILRQL